MMRKSVISRVLLPGLALACFSLGAPASGADPEPRIEGEVEWFSPIKGYGMIKPSTEADREKSVFIHISEVQRAGFKTLEEGQCIRFTPYRLEKGDIIALQPSGC